MTKEEIEQAAIDWRGSSESAYTTDAFIAGAMWMKEQMVDKACNWWRNEIDVDVDETYKAWVEETISNFRNYMLNENKE